MVTNGLCSATGTVTVTENANPTVTITGATTVCQGGKTTLTVSGIGTYAWSQTPAGFTATTATVEVGAGTYQVMVTNGLCSATGTVTITVNSAPTQPTISGGNVTICSGTSATLTASACTDGIYLWSNNATTSSITVTETGIFTVTCTQSSCKSPPSASASVTVSQNLPAPSSVTSNNSCQVVSDNVNEPTLIKLLATCSTGQKPQWFDSAGVLVGTGNSFIASVLVTTTFTVGCKDDQIGCETLPANRKPVVATVIINVKNGGQIEANQSNCGPFIPNKLTNTELPSGGNAPVEYLWLKNLNGDAVYDGDPAKWIPVGLNGEPNTPDYQPELISKTTSFIRCVRSVGCNDFLAETNVVIITINANPTVTITGATTVCQGGKTTLTVSGIGTYAWSQTPAGFTATTATVEVGAGTYQVMVTNGLCSATGTVTVTENANPTGIAATAQNSTCDADIAKNNGSIKLTGFATGLRYDIVEGATYTGTKKYADATDIPANGIVKSGIANPPTNAGTKYTIRVFNGNNCYEDYTVTMQQVVCSCAEVKCMSYGVMKTKSGMK